MEDSVSPATTTWMTGVGTGDGVGVGDGDGDGVGVGDGDGEGDGLTVGTGGRLMSGSPTSHAASTSAAAMVITNRRRTRPSMTASYVHREATPIVLAEQGRIGSDSSGRPARLTATQDRPSGIAVPPADRDPRTGAARCHTLPVMLWYVRSTAALQRRARRGRSGARIRFGHRSAGLLAHRGPRTHRRHRFDRSMNRRARLAEQRE